jgi:hypothetical protein
MKTESSLYITVIIIHHYLLLLRLKKSLTRNEEIKRVLKRFIFYERGPLPKYDMRMAIREILNDENICFMTLSVSRIFTQAITQQTERQRERERERERHKVLSHSEREREKGHQTTEKRT